MDSRQLLIDLWQRGVDSVNGCNATLAALEAGGINKIGHILAIGKAASSMSLGALPKLASSGRGLLITKYGHVTSDLQDELRVLGKFEIIESGHPIPDANSLAAGKRAMEFIQSIPPTDDLVMLVSGGASALVEHLADGVDFNELARINTKLIAEGFSIEQINSIRIQLSKIKGGKLLGQFAGKSVTVCAISDVPSDDIGFIGSGIGSNRVSDFPEFEIPDFIQNIIDGINSDQTNPPGNPKHLYRGKIIASNEIARDAVENYANEMGYTVVENDQTLDQDIFIVATMIGSNLTEGEKGIYIWGGEPTVVLPPNPGVGGRNQSLGLAIAKIIDGRDDITVIAAGTDGTDGPTSAAGAIVDGSTFSRTDGGQAALDNADAGTFLDKADGLFVSGFTGTNVMDLVIAVKH